MLAVVLAVVLAVGELWSPRTDGGVAVQVALTIALVVVLAWAVRRERSLVLLVVGIGLVVLGWYGVRSLH
ncbi:MAG: hypothetical protein AAFY28_18270 [Actinomycetota bacterium]